MEMDTTRSSTSVSFSVTGVTKSLAFKIEVQVKVNADHRCGSVMSDAGQKR